MTTMKRQIEMASADLDDLDTQAVVDVMASKRLALGPKVSEFEKLCAEYAEAKHAIAVSSGTAGLHLLCRAIGLQQGDEVITTPFSFVASTNCFIFEGAKPVFVDIEPDTYCLNPDLIEQAITPRTKAILAVDVFGHPADWDTITRIAEKHGLNVISDPCESLGSVYKGRKTGAFGVGGVLAFYPNKQITTGEGGMILTNRDDIAALCRSMANQGRGEMTAWLEHERLGFNYRMDELSAALGVSQLKKLDDFIAKRQQVADTYNSLLKNETRMRIPVVQPWVRMSHFVYVVALQGQLSRDVVMTKLQGRGVPTRGYFSPIHTQKYIVTMFGNMVGQFPITEDVARRTIALPFHNNLDAQDVGYVVEQLVAVLDELN